MISGPVLKYLKGARLVMPGRYPTPCPASREVPLTRPGAEKLQLEACMAELIEVLASYSISSCGFQVSALRRAWSEEEQREVDVVLERYGQYGLGDGEDFLGPLLLEISSK